MALLAGCASDKPKEKSAPPPPPPPQPVSLTQIKKEILESKGQLQSTIDSLNTLHKSSQPDAQANYNKFSEEYVKLQTKSEALRTRADDLKKKTADYYAVWNKQIEVENPELRRQAVQQKADAERVFSTVSSEMELTRISFNPLMSNLKDVGNYLNGQLSPAALQSVSDLVAKSNAQAKEVNGHLDAIVGSIDKIIAATGEGAPPPATPPAPAAPPAK
jgi:hypothetical protein